jgi:hypothetical protein
VRSAAINVVPLPRKASRTQGQQIALVAAAGEGVGPGIMPHIAAVAAEPAKLDIVAVFHV